MNRAGRVLGVLLGLGLIGALVLVHVSLVTAQNTTSVPSLQETPTTPFTAIPTTATPTATPTPTPTPKPPPSVFISPTSGSVGTSVTVSGNNFNPSQRIDITFDNQLVSSTTANSIGSFNTTFIVPALSAGSYQVRIGNFLRTFFIRATLSVTPRSGPPGTTVTIRGSGFGPGASVNIGLDGFTQLTASANADGRILTEMDIPTNLSGGSKSVSATSSAVNEETSFDVTGILSVDRGQATVGENVTVQGAGFKAGESGISVRLGTRTVSSGIAADRRGVWSASFDIPPMPGGTVDVRASGSSTPERDVQRGRITVLPTILLDVSQGTPGTSITIRGNGARARETITLTVGNNLATVRATADSRGIWSADVSIPPAPGGNLRLVADGSSSPAVEANFTLLPIIRAEEASGFPGTKLSVFGEGFLANQRNIPINFDGNLVGSVSADAFGSWNTEIIIPQAAAGTYPISVPGAGGALRVTYKVTAGLTLSTAQTVPGELIRAVGSGFARDEQGITLYLGDETVATGIFANADGTWDTRFRVPFLPSGEYVFSAAGSITATPDIQATQLILGSHLALNSSTASPGTVLEVRGAGFPADTGGIYLTYDGVVISEGINTDADGSFVRSFVVPPSVFGSHLIAVNGLTGTQNGNGSFQVRFEVRPGIALEKSTGPADTVITLTGTGFAANEQNISITYDGTPVLTGVAADEQGSFQAAFSIPPSGSGPHFIRALSKVSVGVEPPEGTFLLQPKVELSEPAGSIDLPLVVTGTGFAPGTRITLVYDEITQTTTEVDNQGTARIRLPVPESVNGEHTIRLLDSQGNSAQAVFTVEAVPPPAPVLRQPEDGKKGGLFGGYKPTTRWQASEDPSGVTYTWQLAADPYFEFVLFSKSGLATPLYTLSDDEKLARGEYFWRVKAVDRASNESQWSDVHSVKSGIIPVWVTIVVAGLTLVVAVYGGYIGYGYYAYRRQQARELVFPVPVGMLPPRATPALGPGGPVAGLPPPVRRALPLPLRGAGGLSLEDRARLEHVASFLSSIPLPNLSSGLEWLDTMVETIAATKEDVRQEVLDGNLDLLYLPDWLQHPTYRSLTEAPGLAQLLEGLEQYVATVNQCTRNTLSLLRLLAAELPQEPPLDAEDRWRLVWTVALSSMLWFWGTHLDAPSPLQYEQVPEMPEEKESAEESEEEIRVSLRGKEGSPFEGVLLRAMSRQDAEVFRAWHVKTRAEYRSNEHAQALADELAATDFMRLQIFERISRLRQS